MQVTVNRVKLVLAALLLLLVSLASLPALQGLISSAHAAKCDQWGCVSCSYNPDLVLCVFDGGYTCECCECKIVNK